HAPRRRSRAVRGRRERARGGGAHRRGERGRAGSGGVPRSRSGGDVAMSAAIIAYGALSALGEGAAAACAGEIGQAARVGIRTDAGPVRAALARPLVSLVALRRRAFGEAAGAAEGD